jgi:predicted O-linked N-acetylglucosamine transferase (SPINDLY family)
LDLSPFSHPVTFGCFNNPAKITAEVLDTWGEILRRVPRARLVLKYRGLGDETTRRRLGERLAAQGVEGGRLEMQEWSPFREFLAAHDRIDLMLDPFPFSGSLTTCDALWMGVPVITWPGATFASRHSAGHLAAVGLTELVAEDRRQYVELAVRWADDRPRRTALRAGLRRRLAESPLCDGPRAARELMDVVRGAWRAWLSGAEERGETAT